MRDYGIKAKMARRFKKHSHKHHLIYSPNLLLKREPVAAPNEVWVCDVTFIRVGKNWNYLCTIMDLYTRKIIGWHFDKSIGADLAKEALLMALEDYRPQPGAILHTDQGVEFCNKVFRSELESAGLLVSKSRKGCCWDNANMESFYHTLKTEMVYFHHFADLVEAMAHIMDYIRFYNGERLHSGLDYQTPEEIELLAA
jgi:putative transposase